MIPTRRADCKVSTFGATFRVVHVYGLPLKENQRGKVGASSVATPEHRELTTAFIGNEHRCLPRTFLKKILPLIFPEADAETSLIKVEDATWMLLQAKLTDGSRQHGEELIEDFRRDRFRANRGQVSGRSSADLLFPTPHETLQPILARCVVLEPLALDALVVKVVFDRGDQVQGVQWPAHVTAVLHGLHERPLELFGQFRLAASWLLLAMFVPPSV